MGHRTSQLRQRIRLWRRTPRQGARSARTGLPLHTPGVWRRWTRAVTPTSAWPWGRQVPPHQHGPERLEQRPPRVETLDWHARYPQEIVLHGPTDRKQLALTFDDGPDDLWTPQVLDVLQQLHVPATFLCVGQRVQRYPEMVRRMVAEGHVVGNHSWSHPNLTQETAADIKSQIERTNAVIRAVAGVQPRWFRPPYGALNDVVIHTVQSLRMKILYWNVDSLDWTGIRTDQVVANVLAHTEPGAIVLFHCAGGAGEHLDHTVAALPILVDTLRQRGYTWVTVPVLTGQPAYL